MKGYLTCGLCGVSISWEYLEHNFSQIKQFHDDKCGKPRPKTINYAELIKREQK